MLAGGAFRLATQSGSSGEHLESLERLASLRARLLLPGHGPLSDDPAADLAAAGAAVSQQAQAAGTSSRRCREGASV